MINKWGDNMIVNKEEFMKLKRKTFSSLLIKDDNVNKLIRAALVISLCHDKCIKDDKECVCLQFINECGSKIILIPNINLDNKTKFSLIRNKLAHGDYAYDCAKRVIVFEYLEHYVEVSLDNIVDFANSISNYYMYLNKEYPREIMVYRNGMEILVTDYCKKRRDYGYNRKYNDFLNRSCQLPFLLSDRNYMMENGFVRKKICIEKPFMDLECEVRGYSDKDGIIMNPYGDKLLNNMLNLLNNDEVLNNEYKEVSEILINFYILYIYPLDNFMKIDDQGIKTLPSLDNLDFSLFDFSSVRNEDNFDDVGKVKNYPDDLLSLYKKVSLLENRLDSLNSWKNKDEEYRRVKLDLESEINDLFKLIFAEPIKRLYDYSKNRSLIEHIRCSMMHGNYTFDILDNTFTFFDEWKGKEVYRDVVNLNNFKKIFNFYNIELIMEQDRKVNKKKLLK